MSYPFLRKKDKFLIDKFFELIKKIIYKHPIFVVIIVHEYSRNLYMNDKFIKFKIKNPYLRFQNITNNLIKLINNIKELGSYNKKNNSSFFKEFKKNPTNIYAPLWKKFKKIDNDQAFNLLKLRLKQNIFKNRFVLDAGCGGGRYTYAIKRLKAKKVIGVDYEEASIKLAKKKLFKKKYRGLHFRKANILNLPFKNSTFDVVFSNGVIHHSKNLIKGISEAVRVCKKNGKIFLYLYATGGIFWYSRMLMNKILKKIPYDFHKDIDLIKLPENRFIFMDNFYVPIEKHSSHEYIYKILKKLKVSKIEKIYGKVKNDFEYSQKKYNDMGIIWGEGEIRLLITK